MFVLILLLHFGKDLLFILGGKFSEEFIKRCIDEVETPKKGKIYFKDFIQLFHDDFSQSTGAWLQERLENDFDDNEYWNSMMMEK